MFSYVNNLLEHLPQLNHFVCLVKKQVKKKFIAIFLKSLWPYLNNTALFFSVWEIKVFVVGERSVSRNRGNIRTLIQP